MLGTILLWILLSAASGQREGMLIVDERQDSFEVLVGGTVVARGNTAGIPATLDRLGLVPGRRVPYGDERPEDRGDR